MGLDTSHDCWHGPYSQFMRWRTWLAFLELLAIPWQCRTSILATVLRLAE